MPVGIIEWGLTLQKGDPEIYSVIRKEIQRERENLELIASENFPSIAVLEAMGSVMTSKYAEGYPGKRYYGGCQFVDEAENLARERCKQIFHAEHCNVQPHSGTQANMAVYFSLLKPGDTYMALSLTHGGHLSHGHSVNFSGQLYNVIHYGVHPESEQIDMDQVRELAKQHHPKLIWVGFSAYSRAVDFSAFRAIADEVGAVLAADVAHPAGLIAAGIYPDPVPYCEIVTFTTHKTMRGPRGGAILCRKDYAKSIDRAVFPGGQGGPLMHVIAAKAVCFYEALQPEFQQYQRRVLENSRHLASTLQNLGFRIVSGGTDNHLFLVDLRSLGLTGKDAENSLEMAGITVNKNTIPFDPQPPTICSGIRIGTPAVTTRGMGKAEMEWIAQAIYRVLTRKDEATIEKVRQEVRELCEQFPLYPELG
ncbi:MAG: serine hydroxymethyltransferase [bacterium]